MEKLYRHILIPLDGSKLAEGALKHALPVAQASRAKVTFLSAVWPFVKGKRARVTETEERLSAEALAYMKKIAGRREWKRLAVRMEVKFGLAENVILDYARLRGVDLIVLSTHGRTGLKRWVFGSVAEKVLRGAKTEVLLVRSFAKSGK
ncbi:MAG: universal stress protein [Limisphaerales bacterium]